LVFAIFFLRQERRVNTKESRKGRTEKENNENRESREEQKESKQQIPRLYPSVGKLAIHFERALCWLCSPYTKIQPISCVSSEFPV
jgi:hypothetical protein